jgi:hypothetical protein
MPIGQEGKQKNATKIFIFSRDARDISSCLSGLYLA